MCWTYQIALILQPSCKQPAHQTKTHDTRPYNHPLALLQIGAHSMATAEKLAQRVGQQGGAALIIDYGRDRPYTDSLTAIRNHKGVHVLSQPGTADLSAWVDYSALRQAAVESGASVKVHGPVPQGQLLLALGIQARLQALAEVGVVMCLSLWLVSLGGLYCRCM